MIQQSSELPGQLFQVAKGLFALLSALLKSFKKI